MLTKENTTFYMGIDGGGTKCRVRIESADGTLLGTGIGGTANPSHGLETVIASITKATDKALSQAKLDKQHLPHLVVGAGIAGLHLPKYFKLMKTWQHPFKALYLTDDLSVATLGAHDGKDGAVVIVGTGFSALSLVDNEKFAIGGHGFLMADQCSGSWIGYQAVQAALLATDGLGKNTVLTELLDKKFNGRGVMLADALVSASPCEYGALAPLVFAAASQGDEVANQILERSAEFVNRVVFELLKSNPPRLTLMGGIVERILDRLDPIIIALMAPAILSPEQGAIYYAKLQHQLECEQLLATKRSLF